MQAAFPWRSEGDVGDYNIYYFHLVEHMKGKELLSSINDKTGQKWKDPVYTKALTMIKNLWDKGHIPQASMGYRWPAGQQTLARGIAAMELCGAWLPTELSPLTGSDFAWGGFNFPAVAGGIGKVTDLQEWLFAFGVIKTTQHPHEAMDFLKFVMTNDSQKRIVQGLGEGGCNPKGCAVADYHG